METAMEKDKYLALNFNVDYVIKSRQAGLSLVFVILIFSFLHKNISLPTLIINILCYVGMTLSFLRFLNANSLIKQKIKLEAAVKIAHFLVISSSVVWFFIGTLAVLSYDKLEIELLTTFILLNAFSSGSIVTLSTKRFQLLIFNFFLLSPQIFYSVWEFNRSGNFNNFWLIAYAVLNFSYTFKQSKLLSEELKNRFLAQFDLQESLIELEKTNKKLEEETVKTFHASRLSSLGEMASGVAHEINNPLTIIQSISKNIINDQLAPVEDSVKQKLQKVYSAGERINKIVKGMKLLSSKSDLNVHEVISVKTLLDINLDLFIERLKIEQINFTCSNSLNPSVNCNPSQVSQIIVNLLTNAIDALGNFAGEKKLHILVNSNTDVNFMDIRVINSGDLLNDGLVNRLFEPFFTTKDPGKGTGLGLSISKRLAEDNGGNLFYETYEGQICFTLQLKTAKT